MLDKNEIIAKLKDMNLSAVARGAGVNYGTLHYFYTNPESNISLKTAEKLSVYLSEGDKSKEDA